MQMLNFAAVICKFIKKQHITLAILPNIFLPIQGPRQAESQVDLGALVRRVWVTAFTDEIL